MHISSDLSIPALDLLEEIAAELARTAQCAGDGANARALNKAALYIPALHGLLRFSSGDLLVPSASSAGQVYRVSGAGCSCDAGAHGRNCWHAALAEIVLVARDRLADADDGDGGDLGADAYECYTPAPVFDDEPFLCSSPLPAAPGECETHGPYDGDRCPRCEQEAARPWPDTADVRRLAARLTRARLARYGQVAA